jgi:hypothetical protein
VIAPQPGDRVVYAGPAAGVEGPALTRLRTNPVTVVDTDEVSGDVGVYDPQAHSGSLIFWAPPSEFQVVAKANYLPVLSRADADILPAPRAGGAR